MKTVGILTPFYSFDDSYSLVSVVKDHLLMNVRAGYKTILFVLPSFQDDDKVPQGVEIRKVIPQITTEPYRDFKVSPNFQEDLAKIALALQDHLRDIDVVIEHDMIFQEHFTAYAAAIHALADGGWLPNIKWLHWIHSAPSPRPNVEYPHSCRYTLPKGDHKLVYLNHTNKVQVLAEMYSAWPKDVRSVPNSLDPRTFWDLHPFVTELIDKYDLLSADIISVYPLSTPRMVSGKGLDHVIKIHSCLKKQGQRTKLIVANAHANGQAEKDSILELQKQAKSYGLTEQELIFTSLEKTSWEHGIPRKAVSDLFRLSSLFVFPTKSENCSLILLEAMLSGNLLVLNDDVQSLREFAQGNALYFRFGALDDTQFNINNSDNYYNDIAKIILSELSTNKALLAKKQVMQNHNLDIIFKQIEQLYYEQ